MRSIQVDDYVVGLKVNIGELSHEAQTVQTLFHSSAKSLRSRVISVFSEGYDGKLGIRIDVGLIIFSA